MSHSQYRKQMVALLSGYLLFFACTSIDTHHSINQSTVPLHEPYLVVLGIAQDAGYPQANCQKPCCQPAWNDPDKRRFVSCLGLVDPGSGQRWIFDATPDFRDQLHLLDTLDPRFQGTISGILLTHAHIGHYTGLIHLGREVMGAQAIPVYAMPRMDTFLRENGPWDQLVRLNNIQVLPLEEEVEISLADHIRVKPVRVPHRDEYSETVGFYITVHGHRILFIPDIDKWERWDRDLREVLQEVDLAFLDGSFYADGEIPNRNMAEIPHPFITESIKLLAPLPDTIKQKVHFIHFNHTNPILQSGSAARQEVESAGMSIASQGEIINLGESLQ
jgi:pyrroloquinoline quinone biosynthesis protein B